MRVAALLACALPILLGAAAPLEIIGEATLFAPGIASTDYSEVRLTISPDGRTALWFSRNRPGGAGGYDIWMSRHTETGWGAAEPVPFNSPGRDFDPAFSADGRFVYFCSDRPGGMGGDDLYRVVVTAVGFGAVDSLGMVNSAGNEFAPMLSPDGSTLLFSSDRPGGAGRHDLYVAARKGAGFAPVRPVAGAINTGGDEFDATFLSDGTTIVFARAGDFRTDRVDLFHASIRHGQYDAGTLLPRSVNSGADGQGDSYGPMLDWSRPGSLTFSAQRPGAKGMDLYTVGYRLE
jgi:Tol biopolymer transport system component